MRLLLVFSLLACAAPLRAELFRTLGGDRIEGQLAAVYGDIAIIKATNGSYSVIVDTLDDEALRKVAAFLTQPAPQPEP